MATINIEMTRRRVDAQLPSALAWADHIHGIIEAVLERDIEVTDATDPSATIKRFQAAVEELRAHDNSLVKVASLALRLRMYAHFYALEPDKWAGAVVQVLHEFEQEVKQV